MLGGHESTTTCSATHALDPRRAHVFAIALACVALAALLLSPTVLPIAPVAAGPVVGDDPIPRRVSTSPEENSARATPPQARPSAPEAKNTVPLTRAAARRRVEKISPVPWLSRFGPVSRERRE